MSIEQEQERRAGSPEVFEASWAWKGGGLAGLVATLVMGAAITIVDLETLRLAIAGLYGFEGTLVAGWIAHLAHGTLFGVIFAAVLSDPGLYRVNEWVWKTVVAGVVYGLVLAVVGAGLLMPIWLGVAGVGMQLSLPNVTMPVLLWHVVYGIVLGGLFPFLADR
jgi:sterol desaturase/sphingolipid hydroxylase (fatty acid hydroxylase superfamily)